MTKWVQRLLIANVLMYFIQETVPGVQQALVFVPWWILQRPWTIVTYMFLHGGPPPAAEPIKIATVSAESAAEPTTRFFTPRQFAALKQLSALLQPAVNGRPGAMEAGAAEFLDFLIGASPQPRQQLYRAGLDFVDGESRRLFNKPFPEIAADQAEKILRPLLVPWTYDPPADPRQRFLTDLRADLRTATLNSKEMSQVPPTLPLRRVRGRVAAPYWLPIDPTR